MSHRGEREGKEFTKTVTYSTFRDESQLESIMALVSGELSEPYSIFTYRFFVSTFPHLCVLAHHEEKLVGVIVNKSDDTVGEGGENGPRGYIGMLTVAPSFRRLKIGATLVNQVLELMTMLGYKEVTLETEVTNKKALLFYESLGFFRSCRLTRYYLNGEDAFRLRKPLLTAKK